MAGCGAGHGQEAEDQAGVTFHGPAGISADNVVAAFCNKSYFSELQRSGTETYLKLVQYWMEWF